MRIAINPSETVLAVLQKKQLSLYDIRGDEAVLLTQVPVDRAWTLAASSPFVAMLTGELAPAGASVGNARAECVAWDGTPAGSVALGEVEHRSLSFTLDGKRLVATDWSSCRVTLFATHDGARLGAAGKGIPSGASLSADGQQIIAGSADQGSGDILHFDVEATKDGKLAMKTLARPKPSPGLDDAPYFSVWSSDGKRAAISNQTWGGRGVFVYDGTTHAPVWSKSLALEDEESEPEEWFALPLAFALENTLLLAAEAGAIRAYEAATGSDLGTLSVRNGKGDAGFAVQSSKARVWLPGETPTAHAFPSSWALGTKPRPNG